MKVNIQVQCTTKSLDQRYRARAGDLTGAPYSGDIWGRVRVPYPTNDKRRRPNQKKENNNRGQTAFILKLAN